MDFGPIIIFLALICGLWVDINRTLHPKAGQGLPGAKQMSQEELEQYNLEKGKKVQVIFDVIIFTLLGGLATWLWSDSGQKISPNQIFAALGLMVLAILFYSNQVHLALRCAKAKK